MPIIDHIEKIVAPNSSGVTIPYAFNPGALNRYLLVVAMTSTPTSISPSLPSTVTYAGAEFGNAKQGRSIGEGGGVPGVWCSAYARSLLLGEQPLAGDVVIALEFASNLIAYVIGFRGVGSFPYVWYSDQFNSVPQSNISALVDNDYIGVAGFAIKDGGIITSVSGSAELLEQEAIDDDLLSLTGSLVFMPQGQNLLTGTLNGNAGWGAIGWVPLADMDQGVDVLPAPPPPPALEPLSPYVRHELYWRAGIGKPL